MAFHTESVRRLRIWMDPKRRYVRMLRSPVPRMDSRFMRLYTVHERNGFRFVDEGPMSARAPVLLLHGMLGAVGNWSSTISSLANAGYRVLVPVLPVYDLPDAETSVSGLKRFVDRFVDALGLEEPVLVGNSLGGHVALLFALGANRKPKALILTGASGVHEVVMGESTLRRFDREFVRDRAAITFHDPKHASDALVDDMMTIVSDRKRVKKLIKMARSARDEKVEDALARIDVPTLLIWGQEDRVTPPEIALRFRDRLSDARLELIPACGHAPMIEQPDRFNHLLLSFLTSLNMSSNGRPKSDRNASRDR